MPLERDPGHCSESQIGTGIAALVAGWLQTRPAGSGQRAGVVVSMAAMTTAVAMASYTSVFVDERAAGRQRDSTGVWTSWTCQVAFGDEQQRPSHTKTAPPVRPRAALDASWARPGTCNARHWLHTGASPAQVRLTVNW
ncbi:hypothetical protein COCC4DRAFT_55697 [Bipolaris maydis ATCC 48331]|uniref:Uncharacterized protein n=2 Tax=Cochliobolus heterostrophus TaxID=5016 RepID=M2UC80_COCH5|nr:uncharacterized protein COCC4DRAFT_55697 [Bipolaris maydis ATCC 48331]EMD96174.1 hypothetical protein COCHEDRAFT_1026940 [Bipolaris maydis C5]ENI11033.1 hypothetical protein COCC4DRAFT_55697 [Bipolaris maydis ATCC 48331]KAJ6213065.1 hypothetical protein PSV09DRAFT_1026940 [Bipolaris maydis]